MRILLGRKDHEMIKLSALLHRALPQSSEGWVECGYANFLGLPKGDARITKLIFLGYLETREYRVNGHRKLMARLTDKGFAQSGIEKTFRDA